MSVYLVLAPSPDPQQRQAGRRSGAIDNNHIENRIRPVAIGRINWMFVGSERTGKRAAAVMSLIQSAKLNGHDPYRLQKLVDPLLLTVKVIDRIVANDATYSEFP